MWLPQASPKEEDVPGGMRKAVGWEYNGMKNKTAKTNVRNSK